MLARFHKISEEVPEGLQKPLLDENINLMVLIRHQNCRIIYYVH